MSAAGYAARQEDIARIARRALRSREPLTGGTRLIFAARDDTERDLRALVAAEAKCCPFLRFELDRDGDNLRLEVTGPEDAQPIITELFA
jgi:MerR family copper efflux transcriptional regulator